MATDYVALDLETTGLDRKNDAVIEVGAVRFNEGGVTGTISSLVNPRRLIPPPVQNLTGITNADVAAAPPLEVVAADLQAILDGAVLVGHHLLDFDIHFLDRCSIRYSEDVYDTWELASLLLPDRAEYSLASLTELFEIDFPVRHRALEDAEATRRLLLALFGRAEELPQAVLDQVSRWLQPTRLPWRGFFRGLTGQAANPRVRSGAQVAQSAEPLKVRRDARRAEPEEALAILRGAASRPDVFTQFEERPQQREMAAATAGVLRDGGQLVVEAGTGTGKSLAYLIPAACHALATGERVIVSTATINLQDQLLRKDLPAVKELLPAGARTEFRACQLKGRRNYLCLKQFESLRSSPDLSDAEAVLAARVLMWLEQSETGDRAELRLSSDEEAVWRRISADGADCYADNSPFVVDGSCFLQRARRTAESAHVVVVNHSLLLSDTATGGRVLPPYERLIVDEAHHLEEEATRQFGFASSEREVAELLSRCEAIGPLVQSGLRSLALVLGPHSELTEAARTLRQAANGTREHAATLFETLREFLRQQCAGMTEQDWRLHINRSMRVQPDWSGVEIAWENLRLAIGSVAEAMKRLQTGLGAEGAREMVTYEIVRAEGDALLQGLQSQMEGLSAAIETDDPGRVVWVETERSGALSLSSAPLVVSDLLREQLYEGRASLILTGATLSGGGGDFTYLQERLGLEGAETLALGSPFDYKRAALALTPLDMPEPGRPEYLESLGRALRELAVSSRGRALVLFTSHATLRATGEIIQGPLADEGIIVLAQGVDGSPKQLVRALQANPRTVLLGTASFWEGVDIPGDTLSLLVITRLPFNVPTEPVFAARSALYDDPFEQYALPQAVLRFKQGFGRLIRTRTDRGVLVVLDQRITSKSYGATFLASLPGCPVRQAAVREMPYLVQQWLAAAAPAPASAT